MKANVNENPGLVRSHGADIGGGKQKHKHGYIARHITHAGVSCTSSVSRAAASHWTSRLLLVRMATYHSQSSAICQMVSLGCMDILSSLKLFSLPWQMLTSRTGATQVSACRCARQEPFVRSTEWYLARAVVQVVSLCVAVCPLQPGATRRVYV